MEVTDNGLSCQYQVKQNGELALVEYLIQECKIFSTKTLSPESVDEAFIDKFLGGVLALVSQKKHKAVPVCPAAAAFFKRNKGYKEVLSADIRT